MDNGAHLVLICPDLAAQLGLKVFCLHVPEIINVSLKNSNTKIKSHLSKYVKLSFTSLDCQWTS